MLWGQIRPWQIIPGSDQHYKEEKNKAVSVLGAAVLEGFSRRGGPLRLRGGGVAPPGVSKARRKDQRGPVWPGIKQVFQQSSDCEGRQVSGQREPPPVGVTLLRGCVWSVPYLALG